MSDSKRGRRIMNKAAGRALAGSMLSTRKAAADFKKAAAKYTRKVTVSKETARQALVGLGIYTTTGKLTKRYK